MTNQFYCRHHNPNSAIANPQSKNAQKSPTSNDLCARRPDTPTAPRKSLHEPLNALWSILESNPQSQFRNPKSTKTITNRFRATNGNRDDPNYQPHQESVSNRLYSRYRRFRKPIPNPHSTIRNPQSEIHNPQPLAYLRPLPTSIPQPTFLTNNKNFKQPKHT